MSRSSITIICSALLMGTIPFSFAAQSSNAPVKKAAAPVAKAAAPVARTAAPATASPAALQAVATGAGRAPASVMGGGGGNNSKDISEELKIMGQSRNLSMGLLFKQDKDKLTFGTPRTNYEDKVSDKKANF